MDNTKLQIMLRGGLAVTNNAEFDRLQALANKQGLYVRTLLHEGRTGLPSRYDAWIGAQRPEPPGMPW